MRTRWIALLSLLVPALGFGDVACHDGAGAAVQSGFSSYADPLGFKAQLGAGSAPAGSPQVMTAGVGGGGPASQLEMMRKMQSDALMFQTQSEILRMQHESAMTIINNIGGTTMQHYDANGVYLGEW